MWKYDFITREKWINFERLTEKWQISRQGHEQCYYKCYSYAKGIKENKYDERRNIYIYIITNVTCRDENRWNEK